MGFYEQMKTEFLESDGNVSATENGAVGYRTTGKSLLDLNFAVASLRSASDREIAERFSKAYSEDKLLAMKWLFFARDVRGGLGERRLFRTVMSFIAENDPDVVIKTIPLIAEYGRYDDLWCLLDNDKTRTFVIDYVCAQAASDLFHMQEKQPVSILAKWLPSENASSAKTRHYAKILRRGMEQSSRGYRKALSKLRQYIDVVERKMSSGEWGKINYEAVPSRANLIYKNAFMRHDMARRLEYLAKLENGEARINSSVLFPHDIVHRYMQSTSRFWSPDLKGYDTALEAMWKALPDTVGGVGNTIVVADGSGSMTVSVGGGSTSALDVANALAIYFSERSSGEFKDKYITFSEFPQFVEFNGSASLHDKLATALTHDECSNTNIEAVFDLILDTATRNEIKQDDLPANVLIISDMEFDACACGSADNRYGFSERLFNKIRRKYEDAGYKLPRLVFWNVNSRTNTIPVRENDLGVALVSGFSVNICKMVMSGKTDPFECMLETLNSERYQSVEDALK